MSKILLTGGSTFFGQELCQQLLGHGYQVLAVTRRTTSLLPKRPGLEWLQMDLSNPQGIDATLFTERASDIRYIIHASAHHETRAPYPELYQRHVLSTSHLLDVARNLPQLEHFFLISTLEVGGHEHELLSEQWPSVGVNLSPWAQSKAAAESMLAASDLSCGRSILRLAEIVGHSQTGYIPELSGSLRLLETLQTLLRWRSLWKRTVFFPFPFDEAARLYLLPVDEAAQTVARLLPLAAQSHPLEVMHVVGYGEGVSVRQLLRYMLEHYRFDLEPLPLSTHIWPDFLLHTLHIPPEMLNFLRHRTRYQANRVKELLPHQVYSHPRRWQAHLLEYASTRLATPRSST
ncbi:MAG: NAD-dependent epimerase/dehydratase family protein [Oligoflexus sp.]|jgi:nucleoside-diphosphate-sugar epimerase